MSPARAGRHGEPSAGGFSVIELLIALGIVIAIAGVLAQVVEPARAAFERVPAELDLQQRGRTAIDVIAQSLRSAVGTAAANGALSVMVPIVNGAQGVLAADQAGPGASLTLATTPCPNVKDVCGFNPGMTAVVIDGAGDYDIFTVAATAPGSRTIVADRNLSRAYAVGSPVIEIDQFTYRLAGQPDGSFSLIRETAAGAVQPVVDFVTALSFTVVDRQVEFAVWVQAPTGALRRVLADRVFKSSVRMRNAS